MKDPIDRALSAVLTFMGIFFALTAALAITETYGDLMIKPFGSRRAVVWIMLISAFAVAILQWSRHSKRKLKPGQHTATTVPEARLRRFLSSTAGHSDKKKKISKADSQFLNDMLTSMIGQVQHEQDMIAARGKEPLSVRLVPQVPVTNRSLSGAWIGGGALLPQDMAWPEIDDSALQLLVQVDCSLLPAELWEGLGPRSGWLAIFLDPKTIEAKAFHFSDAESYRLSPPVDKDSHIAGYDGRKRARASGYTWGFLRWPVDIVPVIDGKDDPRNDRRSTIGQLAYDRPHDLVTEQCWPFDWATTQLMMDMALEAYERQLPKGQSDFLTPEALSRAEIAVAEAETSGKDAEEVARMRINLDERRAMAAISEFAATYGPSVVERLRELRARVSAMALSRTFSVEAIVPLLADMQSMTWMHKRVPPTYRDGRKVSDSLRLQEGVQVFTLPLTTHHPSANPSWVHPFETQLMEAAKPIYLETSDVLPPTLVALCETIWGDQATSEMGGMGHVPWRYVHEFDEETEVTLVELPTCYLVGWVFGDVDNLVITIKKADLARNDFSKVLVQTSN